MKKLFLIAVVATMFVTCNNDIDPSTNMSDSSTEIKELIEQAAKEEIDYDALYSALSSMAVDVESIWEKSGNEFIAPLGLPSTFGWYMEEEAIYHYGKSGSLLSGDEDNDGELDIPKPYKVALDYRYNAEDHSITTNFKGDSHETTKVIEFVYFKDNTIVYIESYITHFTSGNISNGEVYIKALLVDRAIIKKWDEMVEDGNI